jgi:hypothetical protein
MRSLDGVRSYSLIVWMVVAGSESIFWPWSMGASSAKEEFPEAFNGRGFLWELASDANDGNSIVRSIVRCAHLDMTQISEAIQKLRTGY